MLTHLDPIHTNILPGRTRYVIHFWFFGFFSVVFLQDIAVYAQFIQVVVSVTLFVRKTCFKTWINPTWIAVYLLPLSIFLWSISFKEDLGLKYAPVFSKCIFRYAAVTGLLFTMFVTHVGIMTDVSCRCCVFRQSHRHSTLDGQINNSS